LRQRVIVFLDLLRKQPRPVRIIGLELNGLPDDRLHIYGFVEEDAGVREQNMMSKLVIRRSTTDFSGCSSRVCQWCYFILVSNVDLAKLAADIVVFRYNLSQVALDWPKVTIYIPRLEANGFDVGNSIDGRANEARKRMNLACRLGWRRVAEQNTSSLSHIRHRYRHPRRCQLV
jgi:hypothetical protein